MQCGVSNACQHIMGAESSEAADRAAGADRASSGRGRADVQMCRCHLAAGSTAASSSVRGWTTSGGKSEICRRQREEATDEARIRQL